MFNYPVKFIVFFIICLSASLLHAQERNVKRFSVENGLLSGITDVFHDSRGNIWLTNMNGLIYKFDGINFTSYGKESELKDLIILSIAEDKNGLLWVITSSGLFSFDGSVFKKARLKHPFVSYINDKIVVDKAKNLWFVNRGEPLILKYDGTHFTEVKIPINKDSSSLVNLIVDQSNHVWVACSSREKEVPAFKYDGKKLTEYRVKNIERNNKLNNLVINYSLFVDEYNRVWICQGAYNGPGLFAFYKNAFYPYKYASVCNDVFSISVLPNKQLVLTTRFGKYCRKTPVITGITSNNYLIADHDSVSGFFEPYKGDEPTGFPDKNKNVWVVVNDGVEYYTGNRFMHYGNKQGLRTPVFKTYEDPKHKIWALTYNTDMFALMNDTVFVPMQTILDAKKPQKRYFGVEQDKYHNLWFGSYNEGALMYDGEKSTIYAKGLKPVKGQLPALRVSKIDDKGNVWAHVNGGFLYLLPPNKMNDERIWKEYKLNDKIIGKISYSGVDSKSGVWVYSGNKLYVCTNQNKAKCVFIDKTNSSNLPTILFEETSGKLWFHQANGTLYYYNGKNLVKLISKKSPENIVSVYEDKWHRIWFGTSSNGVFILDGKMFKHLSDKNGLTDNTICNMVDDNAGAVWLGTNNGLNRMQLDNSGAIKSIKHYGYSEGFTSIECLGGSVFKDSKGKIWYGTPRGITVYNPYEDVPNNRAPNLNFTELKLFYNTVNWKKYVSQIDSWTHMPKNLVLPYDKNHLTFSFIGIELPAPDKVVYSFILEGNENKWSAPGPKNEITYSNLAPGTYTFKVKSRNSNGIWNKKPLTYTFTITPPWWSTWWFRTLMVLFAILSVYSIIKWRTRSLLHKQLQLENTIEERTTEIRNQRDEIEEKNKEIVDSIAYAKRLQSAILPPVESLKEYFPQHFLLYLPKDIVAGDFYWSEKINDTVYLAIADCTGHGVPGAMVSVVCANALARSVNEFEMREPSRILDQTRKLVIETFKKSGEAIRDGMDISLFALNTTSGKMTWAGANNALWIVRNGSLIEFDADAQPVGLMDNMKPFTQHLVELQKGDMVFMTTDGFADQFGGEKGKKFKTANLKKLVLSVSTDGIDVQKQKLEEAFINWRTNFEQTDDVTVFGWRV